MYKKFDELFIDETKYGTKIKTDQYLSEGKYPIVDQGQKKISGYTDIEDGIFKEVPAIIFGDHTRLIKYIDAPFFIGADGVKIIRSRLKEINYKYLYYALLNVSIPNTGYNRHFKWLKETKIYYPDSEKQKYIVEVLDKISLIIEKKNKQIEQWDFLLKSLFIEMFGDLVKGKYEIKKLKDISKKISDGIHSKPEYTKTGRPFLSVVNINKGKVNFEDCKYVSEESFQKMIKSTHPEKGDILYTKVGATYGIAAYIDTNVEFCLYVSVCLIKPKHYLINAKFLSIQMNMPFIKYQADNRIKGIGVPDLHLNQIREFDIIVPPLDLQNRFADYVSSIDKSKYSSFSHLSA